MYYIKVLPGSVMFQSTKHKQQFHLASSIQKLKTYFSIRSFNGVCLDGIRRFRGFVISLAPSEKNNHHCTIIAESIKKMSQICYFIFINLFMNEHNFVLTEGLSKKNKDWEA